VIQKKICMLGGFAVGKTSLVARFVHSIFSDKYLTTLGVKIDKKTVDLGNGHVDLILWDIHGEDELQKINMSYLRGAAGYLLVMDGTRRTTVDTALAVHESAQRLIGPVPVVIAINKADLADCWDVDERTLEPLGYPVVKTSAKTGAEVEATFLRLARDVMVA
jgi:small GTP-binding protein